MQHHYCETVITILTKLSEQTGNGSGIIPLNSPGGSTLQRNTGRGLLRLASLAFCFWILLQAQASIDYGT